MRRLNMRYRTSETNFVAETFASDYKFDDLNRIRWYTKAML